MLAGVGLALICLSLTPLALIARAALADVVVEAVLAGASIETRVDGAFIDVRLTPRSVVASWAVAFEPSHHIHALSSVQARVAETLINLCLAVDAGVSSPALARVSVDPIHAVAVQTGIGVALVDVVLAVGAPSAHQASTLVAVGLVLALSSVLAR